MAARQFLHLGLCLVAQAALGSVEDALKSQIVIGADHDAEIGHRIANFHPLVKARAADHAVGQADGQEAILERAHLVRGAHKDRHVIGADGRHAAGAARQSLDLFADPAGFFLAIPMADQAELFALLADAAQRFTQPFAVVRDDPVGGLKDMGGRAVVFLQTDDLCAGEILLKAQDVANLGSAPAIDRLIIIPHDADVGMARRQKPEPQILGDVGVLVLIHKDEAEPALILGQEIGMGLKDRDHVQEKITEIDRVQIAQAALILGV